MGPARFHCATLLSLWKMACSWLLISSIWCNPLIFGKVYKHLKECNDLKYKKPWTEVFAKTRQIKNWSKNGQPHPKSLSKIHYTNKYSLLFFWWCLSKIFCSAMQDCNFNFLTWNLAGKIQMCILTK